MRAAESVLSISRVMRLIVALRMGSFVVIAVCDRGLGIDADELDKIGDQYFRGQTPTGRGRTQKNEGHIG